MAETFKELNERYDKMTDSIEETKGIHSQEYDDLCFKRRDETRNHAVDDKDFAADMFKSAISEYPADPDIDCILMKTQIYTDISRDAVQNNDALYIGLYMAMKEKYPEIVEKMVSHADYFEGDDEFFDDIIDENGDVTVRCRKLETFEEMYERHKNEFEEFCDSLDEPPTRVDLDKFSEDHLGEKNAAAKRDVDFAREYFKKILEKYNFDGHESLNRVLDEINLPSRMVFKDYYALKEGLYEAMRDNYPERLHSEFSATFRYEIERDRNATR